MMLALGCSLPAVAQINIDALKARAAGGDAEAHTALGNAYVNGQGVERDIPKAMEHYEQAVAAGSAPAAFNLGLLHEVGRGVEIDLEKAFGYYLQAAELGMDIAQFNVGNMYARGIGVKADPYEANIWFRRAADAGVADAQYNLGLAYENGIGLAADPAQAIHWYQLALQQGHVRATYNLALIYEEGKGVPRDDAEAARLYRLAADRNYGPAQNNLGVMYAEGRGGLTQSLTEAYPWFVLAAENGASPRGRDVIAQRLDRIQQAEADIKLLALRNRLGLPSTTPPPAGSSRPAARPPSATPSPASTRAQEELVARVTELENILAQLRRENMGLVSANQTLSRQKSELEARSLQTAPLTQAAQAELAHINTVARELADMEGIDPERRRLFSQAVGLLERISRDNLRLNADVKSATLELSSLNRRLRRAESQLSAATRESAGEVDTAELAAAREDAERFRSQLDQARARIQGLETGMAAVEDLRRRVAELTAQNRDLSAQLAEMASAPADAPVDPAVLAERDDQIARLRALAAQQEGQLQATALEMEALQTRVDDLDAALDATRSRLAAAPSDEELARARNEVAGLQSALADRDRRIGNLETELDRQAADAASAAATDEQAARLAAELETLRSQRDTEQRDLAAARSNLAAAEAATAAVREQLARANSRVTELEDNAQAHDQQVARLQTQLAEQRTQSAVPVEDPRVGELTATLAAESTLRAELEQQLTTTRGDLSQLQDQLREASEQTSSLQAGLAERDAAVLALREALAEAESAPEPDSAALARVASLEEELATAETRLAELRTELGRARNGMTENDALVSQLAAENDQLRARLATPGEESKLVVEYQRVIAEQSDRLYVLTQARDTAVAQADLLSTQLQEMQADLANAETAVSELATSNDALGAELTMARAQIGTNIVEADRLAAAEAERDVAVTRLDELSGLLAATRAQLDENESTVSMLAGEVDRLQGVLNMTEPSEAHVVAQNMAKLQADHDAALATLNERDAALAAAESQLAESLASITVLSGEVDELRSALATAQEGSATAMTEQNALIASLEQERDQALADAQAQQTESADNIAALSREVDELRSALTAAREGSTATTSEQNALIASLERARDQALADVETQQVENAANTTAFAREVDELRSALKLAREDASATAFNQDEIIVGLEQARDQALADAVRIGEEHQAATAALDESTATIDALTRELDGLRAELAGTATALEAADQSALIAELEQTRDAALAETERLATRLAESETALTDNASTITELNGRIAVLEGTVSDRSVELAALETTASQLRQALGEADQAESERIAELSAARDMAVAAVAAAEAKLATRESELAQHQVRITGLDERIAELEEASARSGDAHDASTSALRAERDQARAEVGRLTGLLSVARSEADAFEVEAAALSEQVKATTVVRGQLAQAQSDLTAAQDDLSSLRDELANTQSTLAQRERTVGDQDGRISDLAAEVDRLEAALVTADRSNEIANLIEQRDAAAGEAERLTTELAGVTAVAAQREDDIAALRAQLDVASADQARLGETTTALEEARAEASALAARMEGLQAELADAGGAYARQLAELEAAQAAVSANGEEVLVTVRAHLEEAQAETARVMAARNELQAALDAAQAEQETQVRRIADLETQALMAAEVAGRAEQLEQALVAAEEARDQALAEASSLREGRTLAQEASAASVQALEGELSLAQAQMSELQREIENWRQLAANADVDAKEARSELARQADAHAAEVENFQTVAAVQLQSLQDNETALAELRDTLAARDQQLTDLSASERSALNQVEELTTALATSEEQARLATELRQQLADARSQVVEAERAAQMRVGDLGAQLVALEGQVNRDELALQDARAQVASLEQELSVAQEGNVALEAEIAGLAGLAAELELAEAALTESQGRVTTLQQDLADARQALTDADQTAELEALATARDAAQAQADELQAEAARLSADLLAQRDLAGALEAEVAAQQTRLADLDQQTVVLQTTEQQVARLESDLAAALEQMQVATESTEAMTAARDQALREVDRLAGALVAAEAGQSVQEVSLLARNREADDLRQLLTEAESTAAARADELVERDARLAALQAENEGAQARVSELVASLAAAEQALVEADQSEVVATLEAALATIRTERTALNDELVDVKAEVARRDARLFELERGLAQADREATQLAETQQREVIVGLEAERDRSLNRVTELEEEMAALNATADSRYARIVELESELELNLAAIADLETARDSAAEAADQLSTEILSARETLSVRETEVADLQQRLNALDTELADTRQALADADQSELVARLQSERDGVAVNLTRAQESLVARESEVATLQAQVDELEVDLVGAQRALAESDQSALVASLQAERDAALAQGETDRQVVAVLEIALQEQAERLTDAEALRDAAQVEVRTLQDQVMAVRSELAEREAWIYELERSVQQNGEEASQLAAAQSALTAAEEANAALQQQLTAALAAAERNDRIAALAALETARDEALADANRLTGELEQAWSELEQNTATIAALSAENSDLGDRLAATESLSRSQVGRISELETELSTARSALQEADQSAALAALETARDVAEAQADQLRRELSAVESSLAQAQDNETRLQTELASAQAGVQEDYSEQIAALERARDTAVATADQLGEELTTAQSSLEENMTVIAELTGRNDRLQVELTRAQQALTTAREAGASREVVQALERERDTAQAEARQLGRELSAAQTAVDENSVTIAELTGENDRLQGDLDASERALAAALAAQAAAVEEAGMNAALNMEVTTLHNRVQQLEENIASERSSAAREFAGLSKQLQRARETNQSLIEANRALLATRAADEATSSGSLAALEQEVADLAQTADTLRADNLALQTALTEAQSAPQPPADWERTQESLSQRIKELEVDLGSAQAVARSVSSLRETNDLLRTEQADLEARLSQALTDRGSSDARTRELSTRVAELESQLTVARGYQTSASQLSGQVEDLLADNLALQTALTEARAAPKPPADWQQQRGTLTARIEALETELSGAQALEATVNQLTAANRALRQNQAGLEQQLVDAASAQDSEASRNRALAQRVSDLENQLTSAQSWRTRAEQLSDARETLLADNQALQTALAEARAAPKPPADWQQQRGALTSRIESLQSELTTARSYETTAGELMEANQALLASQGILEVRIADTDAAYQNAQARADALENRLAELDPLPDRLNVVQTELVTLQGNYDAVSRENDALAQQIADAQAAARQQQQQARSTWSNERAQLEAELARLRASTTELTTQSDNDQAQLASLIGEVTAARSRITDLEEQLLTANANADQLDTVNERVRSAEGELQAQRVANSRLQQSLTTERRTHENRLAALERENAALNTRLRQAQNTLDQIAAAARVLNPGAANVPTASRAPLNTAASATGAAGGERTHVVVEGDSLTRISLRYYGTPTRWQEIYQANRETLSEANALRPGQRLRIP
jgi:TPR repeat protein/chromosome segregation ATPase